MLASVGALLALLAWIAVGALTGLGKAEPLLFPLMPVVAIAGALLAVSRLRLLLWIVAGATILLAVLVAVTPLTTALLPTRALVRRDSLPGTPPPALDGVVVLSGGVTSDSLLEPEALDRLLGGLSLMQRGAAPLLIVTRARRATGDLVADRDQEAVRALVDGTLPMLFVDSVHTTRDEAVNSWRVFQQRGIRSPRVGVVTSPLHSRRACATFERVGFVVTCVPAASRAYSVGHARSFPQRFELFRKWLYERAAWMEYRARGWVK